MEKMLLLKAIKEKEVIKYLEGKDGYNFEVEHWVNASAPTDWTKIIPKGIYAVYRENPEFKIDEIYEDALLEMMDGDPFDIYVALPIIHFQLIREERNASPFTIDKIKVLKKLSQTLIRNKEKLMNYFEWEGKKYKEGIWGEVIRIDKLFKSKWNISIIDYNFT